MKVLQPDVGPRRFASRGHYGDGIFTSDDEQDIEFWCALVTNHLPVMRVRMHRRECLCGRWRTLIVDDGSPDVREEMAS